jgi:hypothetical protein
MTNKLEEIQEENRKFIIMANNPTAKTYDEALKMELEKLSFPDGFIVNSQAAEYILISDTIYFINWEQDDPYDHLMYISSVNEFKRYLTRLNRVLIAICEIYSKIEHSDIIDIIYIYDIYGQEKIKWDLTKETLEEQSEETQKEINRIINSN